jgi:hypothetical protein
MRHVGNCQSPTPDLFQLAIAHLHLWLLQRQLRLITPPSATSLVLNAAMQMLQAAGSCAAELAAAGHEMEHFEAACWAARHHLEATAAQRMQQAAAAFALPPPDALASACGADSYRCPRGQIPPAHAVCQDGGGLEAARLRAALNLGSLPIANSQPGCLPFSKLLELLQSPELQRQDCNIAAQHALCTVEKELFPRAVKGFADEAAMTQQEVDALVEVVDVYLKGAPLALNGSPNFHPDELVDVRCKTLGWQLVAVAAFTATSVFTARRTCV